MVGLHLLQALQEAARSSVERHPEVYALPCDFTAGNVLKKTI